MNPHPPLGFDVERFRSQVVALESSLGLHQLPRRQQLEETPATVLHDDDRYRHARSGSRSSQGETAYVMLEADITDQQRRRAFGRDSRADRTRDEPVDA